MAAKQVLIQALVYPRNKTVAPFPATIVGLMSDPSLSVGGGPIEPPPDIQPKPPLVIWGGGNEPYPTPPINLPPEGPPDVPPPQVEPPHEGWNWSQAMGKWYLLYIPGPGDAQPKK